MSAVFISYLWHYLAARALYDELVRPMILGHITSLALLGLLVAAAFFLGRRSDARRRR